MRWQAAAAPTKRISRFGGSLAGTPPVPTTAIFSRTDGICAWQGCMEKTTATSESIEVESSHCGMGHHPAAVYAVADRLAQPEGQWSPFDRRGWRSLVIRIRTGRRFPGNGSDARRCRAPHHESN